MLEELNKQISLTDELINNLPTNNIKNMEKFIKEISLEIDSYKDLKNKVVSEFERRLKEFSSIKGIDAKDYTDIENKLLKALSYTNSLSTPYEKLDFDKYLYQLSKYEEDELINNNIKIIKIIDTFKKAGVPLTINDFNYTSDVKRYMQMFFEDGLTKSKIKNTFEKSYFKSPDIIIHIGLNFRKLYLKNEQKFNKYIESLNNEIKNNFIFGKKSLSKDYSYIANKSQNFINKENIILDFCNQNKDIEEYTDEKVKTITSNIFMEGTYDESKINLIISLLNTLKEYKSYLKYKDLIDEAKKHYNEQVEKDFLKKRFKKISGLEKKLVKLNKKSKNNSSKTKVERLRPQITSTILEIKTLYDEIDDNLFKVIIKTYIKDTSTIFMVLLCICQYYKILSDYFISKNNTISYKEIDEEIKEIQKFTLNPNNTLIGNITILDDKDFASIIATNYRLLNIRVDEYLKDEASLEVLINDLEKVVLNYHMHKLDINISKLIDIKLIKGVMS